MPKPKRTQPKIDRLTHPEQHGRADPTAIGGLYFQRIRSPRDKNSDAKIAVAGRLSRGRVSR